ncbi:MAG: hypothetical protein AB2826_24630 [Candidatus Thiodiazotropha sp.]
MEVFDAVNLSITIGLGILSLGLGGFSIWLSLKFNDKSNVALDSVKDLSNELKSLMEVSLTHQKDFSSKMLDSILDTNQYGTSSKEAMLDHSIDTIGKVLSEKLTDTERHLSKIVEEKIKGLSDKDPKNDIAIQNTIDEILGEISSLRQTATDVSTSIRLPDKLKEKLLEWKDFPAHYVILACIIREAVTSIEGLEQHEEKYHFPVNYDSGLENLIESGIIVGDFSEFEVPSENLTPLTIWIDANWPLLRKYIKHYATKEEETVTELEISLAEKFVF